MRLMNLDYDEDEELDKKDDDHDHDEDELNAQKYFTIDYKCEDCDYLWKAKQEAELSEENSQDDQWVIDESNVSCPICGSYNISRL